jgi:hypothetical protein
LKNLVLISILIALLTGCSYPQFKSFQQTSEAAIRPDEVKPWFSDSNDHYLFNSEIDIYRNHFGGMMVLKYLSKENCRVVYITEVGIKVFDMEFFTNGDFKLHYCLDAINRKIIIKTLRNDISLLLANIASNNKIKISVDDKLNKSLVKSTDHSLIKYYVIDNKSLTTDEILTRKCLQKKVEIKYFSNNRAILDSVQIKHYNIRLKINLSRVNENKSDVPE